ncbi:MAG: hypothetical protein ACYDBW_06020 [Sulfuricaulis sp.]
MRSFSIIGAAIAALGLTAMPSTAMAGISVLSMQPATAVASIGGLAVTPEAPVAAGDGCEGCVMPAPLRDGETDLVITTTLADGGYIAVWQDRNDGHVYGRCYVSDGSPRGAQFHIGAHVEDGILPVIVPHRDGGFAASWSRDGKKYEQRFNAHGVPRGDEVQLK